MSPSTQGLGVQVDRKEALERNLGAKIDMEPSEEVVGPRSLTRPLSLTVDGNGPAETQILVSQQLPAQWWS